jgi:MraZ protein
VGLSGGKWGSLGTPVGAEVREVGRVADRFYGTFTPRLDDKGRITLPARYRTPFNEGAMVVKGNARCLYVFTVEGFDTFAEDAINASVTDTAAIGQARYMLANTDLQVPDSQGRITLSSRMRDYAELDRDVVLTGQGYRMEIWNAERWAEYEAAQEANYVDPPAPAVPLRGDL